MVTSLKELQTAYSEILTEAVTSEYNQMLNDAIASNDVNEVKRIIALIKGGKTVGASPVMKEEVETGAEGTEKPEKKETPKKEAPKGDSPDIWKKLSGKEFHVAMQEPEFQNLLKKEMKAQDIKGVMLLFMNLNGAVNSSKPAAPAPAPAPASVKPLKK